MNMNVDIYYYLSTKNMMSFTIGLDTLYIKKKNGIEYVTSHNYGEIEVGSYDSLPLKNIIENYCKPTWTKIEGLPVYEKPK